MLAADVVEEYSCAKHVPDFYFPVVQAEITECSTYVVVCRLKASPPYIITSKGGSFNLPDYPSVCVTIPKNAVAPMAEIPAHIKVGFLVRICGLKSAHAICFLESVSVIIYSFRIYVHYVFSAVLGILLKIRIQGYNGQSGPNYLVNKANDALTKIEKNDNKWLCLPNFVVIESFNH